MSARCEYMGGTRVSDVLSRDGCGTWGEMCRWSMRNVYVFGSGWEVRVLGLGFTNPVGSGGLWDGCPCCGGVGVGGVGWWLGPRSERVGWCNVCVCVSACCV